MSKNTTDRPVNTNHIRRIKSFDPTIPRSNFITQLPLYTSSDAQEELELSGNDKRPNPSCCELL